MNDDWTIEKDGEVRWQGILVHEYVPGEYTHPMRTEPDCRDCGEAVLREMALEKLDESGGAEWTTTTAYEDYEWYDGGQAPKGLT
jgi:hypothetical protein